MSAYSDLIAAHAALRTHWRLGELSGTTFADAKNGLTGTFPATAPTLGVKGAILGDTDTAMSVGTAEVGGIGTVPDNNLLDLGDDFTIEFWIKRGTIGAGQTVITKGTDAYRVGMQAANTVALFKVGVAGNVLASSTPITDALWHYVGVSKAGATRLLVIDGVDVSVLGTNQTFTDNTTSLRIGAATTTTQQIRGAGLDEVALYSAGLTLPEMVEHWEEGIARLGLATETDEALPVSIRKTREIGQAEETDEAQPVSSTKRREIGQAAEIDEAQPLTSTKRTSIGQASEVDEAQSLGAAKARTIGIAEEVEEALPVEATKRRAIGLATEVDEALPVTRPGVISIEIGVAEEVDEALPLTLPSVTPPAPTHHGATGIVPERIVRAPQRIPIGLAVEVDEALPVVLSMRQSEDQDLEELFLLGVL